MSETYTQCRLQKGNMEQIAYIPTIYAKENNYIKIKGDNGWKVTAVGGTQPKEFIINRERQLRSCVFGSIENNGGKIDWRKKNES